MTTVTTAAIHTAGTVLQKRYQLNHPIAVGGMAEFWQGTDRTLQREVAIKILHPHLAREQSIVERFRKEAISAARLSHPNIVPTFDAGISGDYMFVIQGLINGISLAEVLATKRFTPYESAAFGRQIADALDHAHQHELIHRDIRPENLLLVDRFRRMMVTDFGIAKAAIETADTSRTMPGIALASPAFCAPEQTQGEDPTPQGDIYSLGLILHEMVCGHIAAEKVEEISILHQQNNGYSADCTALPATFAVIVRNATADSPADRYVTAGEMRDSLADCIKTLDPPPQLPTHTISIHNTAAMQLPASTPENRVESAQSDPNFVANAAQRVEIEQARRASDRLLKRAAITVGVLVLLAIALGTAIGVQIRNTETAQPQFDRQSSILSPTAMHSFDPLGDNTENEAQIRSIGDGDPGTSWSSETYATRKFGNLKPGVGIILQFTESSDISQISVDSPSAHWEADVFVNTNNGSTPTQWGQTVGKLRAEQSGTTSTKLTGIKGNAILLWFTDLGDQNRITVSEITVSR